jgi:arylsulfatase A-like enzyme
MQDCFDSFQNTQLQQSKPWRINGVPQHDTYAQRRQVYLDYINRLSDAEKKLAKELKEYQQQISVRHTNFG